MAALDRISIAALGNSPAELAEQASSADAAGPLDKVRARVAEVAARGNGVFLTPATYFIPPEQIGEYQAKIIEAFGSAT